MENNYKCYRCFFKTSRRSNITTHLNRKKKCIQHKDCCYNEKEIDYLQEKQLEDKYKFKIRDDDYEKKIIEEYRKTNPIEQEKTYIPNVINNITNNFQNTMNIQNNTIINININNDIIPFDQDWDLSTIDKGDRYYLMVSKVMYTKLLEMILKNDINSNVIVDNDSSKGLVFYKDKNKYETIELNTLVSESVKKLHKQLIDIYKSVIHDLDEDIKENMINPSFINEFIKNVEQKYKDFQDKSTIKEKVQELIIDIYKKNQEKALSIMKKNSNDFIQF